MTQSPFALVCDLDGTLIDSAPDLCTVTNAVLAEHGLGPLTLAQVQNMVGDGLSKLIERAFAQYGQPLTQESMARVMARFLALYEPLDPHKEMIYPFVVDTLTLLKRQGWRLGVCTNKPQKATVAILAKLNLAPLFDAIVGGDMTPQRKPHPRHLLRVLEDLGSIPARAVMVGDGINDVKVARGVGIPVVAVAYGYPHMPVEDLGADRIIEGFDDLPGTLALLGFSASAQA